VKLVPTFISAIKYAPTEESAILQLKERHFLQFDSIIIIREMLVGEFLRHHYGVKEGHKNGVAMPDFLFSKSVCRNYPPVLVSKN
jgi:hypothetical protein